LSFESLNRFRSLSSCLEHPAHLYTLAWVCRPWLTFWKF